MNFKRVPRYVFTDPNIGMDLHDTCGMGVDCPSCASDEWAVFTTVNAERMQTVWLLCCTVCRAYFKPKEGVLPHVRGTKPKPEDYFPAQMLGVRNRMQAVVMEDAG